MRVTHESFTTFNTLALPDSLPNLLLMFQAVFTWSVVPADAIDAGFANLGNAVRATMPDGVLRSLIADGVIAGVGAVVVFLPQILILFFFILQIGRAHV